MAADQDRSFFRLACSVRHRNIHDLSDVPLRDNSGIKTGDFFPFPKVDKRKNFDLIFFYISSAGMFAAESTII